MAAQHIWFLPPDFTFLPGGDLALGTVISDPSRPTLALARLEEYHPRPLPEITSIIETSHEYSRNGRYAFGAEVFARVVSLASLSRSVDTSRYKDLSISAVDHEIRSFSKTLSHDALDAISKIDKVRQHTDKSAWRFGKRNVYVITGLRIAVGSFTVVQGEERAVGGGVEVSGPVMAMAGIPVVEVGGGILASRDRSVRDVYNTAPGVIFAYRLHVIRTKRAGAFETELFSHSLGFCTPERPRPEEEGQQVEFIPVDEKVIGDDLAIGVEFDRHSVGEDRYIVFKEQAY